MNFAAKIATGIAISLFTCSPVFATHPVTGNGFGFAVVVPETASVSKFYAHPYGFSQPSPQNPLSEGIETTNFLRRLGWGGVPADHATAEYVDDSHVIHAHSSSGDGFVFMPFGLLRSALIVDWEPLPAEEGRNGLQVEWSHAVASQKSAHVLDVDVHLLRFNDIPESLILIPLGRSWAAAQTEQVLASNTAWALISIENEGELEPAVRDFTRWLAGAAPGALVKREIAELDRWRVKPTVHFASENERHLWRQSEVTLRIAQSREPNRPGRYSNGLIVASLPDGVYATPWVRDMAVAADALARMGHRNEARSALLAYFNARPTGKMRAETNGADYQISVVRYFGDGSEEPFFTEEGNTNIEFDDWGLALWVLGECLQKYDDTALLKTATYRGSVYESARDYVVKPLLANTEKFGQGRIVDADTSIWEEHQKDKKHFAFSSAMAIVGLRSFANIAHRMGDEDTHTAVLSQVAQLEKGFDAAFIRDGKLHGTLEEGVKNDIDGALLAVINYGIVTDPAVVRDTMERMDLLKVASGGYRRVRGTYTDPAIFEYWYEQEEFLFVDFSLAEVLRNLGKDAPAAVILKRIVDKASLDHNIIPEMYVAVPCKLFPGAIGDPTGAIPMVGYGAGAFIVQLLDRSAWESDHRASSL
jgi:hypothetical protein